MYRGHSLIQNHIQTTANSSRLLTGVDLVNILATDGVADDGWLGSEVCGVAPEAKSQGIGVWHSLPP